MNLLFHSLFRMLSYRPTSVPTFQDRLYKLQLALSIISALTKVLLICQAFFWTKSKNSVRHFLKLSSSFLTKIQFKNPETQFFRNFYFVNSVPSALKSCISTEKVWKWSYFGKNQSNFCNFPKAQIYFWELSLIGKLSSIFAKTQFNFWKTQY